MIDYDEFQRPEHWGDDVMMFTRGDVICGRDEHGEFRMDAGGPIPHDADELGYEPCNAVLKFTYERYGETRYCRGMASSNFNPEEGSPFCKHHRSREALMKQWKENFKTGAFVQSYANIFDYLEPHKKVVAVEIYKDLLSKSKYDFEEEAIDHQIDMSEAGWFDGEACLVEFPVATEEVTRAKALWFATLDFIRMESIETQLFEDAFSEELAVGERMSVVGVSERGEHMDRTEHHLNLPLSRIAKDYERNLKFGGVALDKDGDENADMSERQWVVSLGPKAESDSKPSEVVDEEGE